MKRAVEAFQSLYTVLFHLYLKEFLQENPLIEKEVREEIVEVVTNMGNYHQQDQDHLVENHMKFLHRLDTIGFDQEQSQFDKKLNNVAKYLRNCILLKYFFAHDLQNYARYIPIYLSEMCKLEESDEEVWRYLSEGNFSVSKSTIPFTSIGPDHALEQENKTMKISGGIIGIGNQQSTIDQHFLIAQDINYMLVNLNESLHLTSNDKKRNDHYQLTTSNLQRTCDSVLKIRNVLNKHEVTFKPSDNL